MLQGASIILQKVPDIFCIECRVAILGSLPSMWVGMQPMFRTGQVADFTVKFRKNSSRWALASVLDNSCFG